MFVVSLHVPKFAFRRSPSAFVACNLSAPLLGVVAEEEWIIASVLCGHEEGL